MNMIIFLSSLFLLGVIATGFFLHRHPIASGRARHWFAPTLAGNLLLFFAAQLGLMAFGVQEAFAATEAASTATDLSVGTGLAIIGIGLPTVFSTIAAALAVGPIGAASLAAVAEKPEMFGRSLVYLGLAEGIAIYGLVLSILLLDKV